MRSIAKATLAVTPAVALASMALVGPAFADTHTHPGAAVTTAASAAAESDGLRAKEELPAFAGHAYRLEVDNGVVFRNSYSADGTTLHWEALEGPMKGHDGDEKLSVREIRDGVYHINWVEASGMTVSHVMDLTSKTVSVYWTYVGENGDRVGELHTASLTRIA